MEAIIEELFLDLEKAVDKIMTDGEWTKTIKSIFEKVGHKHEYEVRPSSDGSRQWLYDIIWYKGDLDSHIKSLDLICESELDISKNQVESVLYDFNKLLVSNALTKIMITHTYEKGRLEDIIKACKKAVEKYSNVKNTVLLINYDSKKGLEKYWIEPF